MRSRSLGLVAMTLIMGLTLALTGCKKTPKDQPKDEPSAAAKDESKEPGDKKEKGDVPEAVAQAGAAGAELAAFLKDEKKAMTADLMEKFLLSLATCDMAKFGIDYKCAQYKMFTKARGRRTGVKGLFGMYSKVGSKHIGHESPAVRYMSASLMSSMFGSKGKTQEIILEAARKEKEPVVLAKMLQVVGSRHKKNEEIKKLLMKMADHEHERVRQEAMSWFTTSFGAGVDGTFEKVLEHLDNDKSIKVRGYLCSRLYGSGDKRAIKALKKYVNAKDTPKELYQQCFCGLIRAWGGLIKPKEPSQDAYQTTLKILKATPRSKTKPPSRCISDLGYGGAKSKSSFHKAWLGKVKGWYKPKTMIKVLVDIASDKDTHWMTRTAAVRSLAKLGADKKALLDIKAKYKGAKSVDGFVVKEIDRVTKKM